MRAKRKWIKKLSIYNGYGFIDSEDLIRMSSEYLKFYKGIVKDDIICAFQDEKDHITYYLDGLNGLEFAESFAHEGHVLHVYETFLPKPNPFIKIIKKFNLPI
jgi:hypothetical protein